MDSLTKSKTIAYIDLNKMDYDIKTRVDLSKYIGGVGVGLKLLSEHLEEDPIILSIGPLNGFFPYCSKTSIVSNDNGVIEDIYVGGSLSSRIKFTGLDSIVITGKARKEVTIDIMDDKVSFKPADTEVASLGLPGKRSILSYNEDERSYVVDRYFAPPERILEKKFPEKKVKDIVITGSRTFAIKNATRYEDLIKKLLSQHNMVTIEKSNNPSCIGCPMGCKMSRIGEIGGNVLTHSLVACSLAEPIFSDLGITFSCLNYLGYDYTHEDIENFPELVKEVLQKCN
jgi:hypothetical protein